MDGTNSYRPVLKIRIWVNALQAQKGPIEKKAEPRLEGVAPPGCFDYLASAAAISCSARARCLRISSPISIQTAPGMSHRSHIKSIFF